MENFDQDPILDPRQISLILLATLIVFLLFAFWIDFISSELMLLIGEIIMIIPAFVYVIALRFPILPTFRLSRVNFKVVPAVIFLFIPVFVLIDELDRLVQLVFPMPEEWLESMTELMQINNFSDTVLIVGAAVIVAPFAEEMLFRGLVQRTLEHYREPAIAIVLTSVLFALVHFNPWTSIQITLLGLLLGYMAWKSGSILPCMLLHGLNNLVSLLFMNMDETRLSWYSQNGHVKIIWLAVALVIFFPAFQLFKRITESMT